MNVQVRSRWSSPLVVPVRAGIIGGMTASPSSKAKLAQYFKQQLRTCRGDYDITITGDETKQILRYFDQEKRYRLLPEEVCPEVKTLSTGGSVAWWLVRFLFKRLLVNERSTAMVCFETATGKALVHLTADGRYRRAGHL